MISIYSIAVYLFVGSFLSPPFLAVGWYLMAEPDYHDMYYDANNKKECESIGGAWEAFEPYCINSDYDYIEIYNQLDCEYKGYVWFSEGICHDREVWQRETAINDANTKLKCESLIPPGNWYQPPGECYSYDTYDYIENYSKSMCERNSRYYWVEYDGWCEEK